jgi:hypothetical protein
LVISCLDKITLHQKEERSPYFNKGTTHKKYPKKIIKKSVKLPS